MRFILEVYKSVEKDSGMDGGGAYSARIHNMEELCHELCIFKTGEQELIMWQSGKLLLKYILSFSTFQSRWMISVDGAKCTNSREKNKHLGLKITKNSCFAKMHYVHFQHNQHMTAGYEFGKHV